MKDLEFLKTNYISNKGIYDNINIFENTLESFNEALKNNLILNLKIRLTKDNIIVVYNDSDLTRLMHLKDKIIMTTYEELLYLNKYHIPTFEEVLKLVAGKVPIIINPKTLECNNRLQKELVKLLDNYSGKFAIVNNNSLIIRWYNKNRPNYIIGEIMSKSSKLKKFNLLNYFVNFTIASDFISIDIEYYNIIKMKNIKEKTLLLGYIADTKEKFNKYKDVTDNLYIEKTFYE
ncbi:MAG: glycerophosphodiester phosphodiesterase family protein [Bacilli bacterium]|nr:glycerophosphodiester phosphodiesterase family protein [Bacilli bacterium]MDD4406624.1 glycerophosphodiester phosphodiesterase family protein [Bacilli bacterium]